MAIAVFALVLSFVLTGLLVENRSSYLPTREINDAADLSDRDTEHSYSMILEVRSYLSTCMSCDDVSYFALQGPNHVPVIAALMDSSLLTAPLLSAISFNYNVREKCSIGDIEIISTWLKTVVSQVSTAKGVVAEFSSEMKKCAKIINTSKRIQKDWVIVTENGVQGSINCTIGGPNDQCRLYYSDKSRKYGMSIAPVPRQDMPELVANLEQAFSIFLEKSDLNVSLAFDVPKLDSNYNF